MPKNEEEFTEWWKVYVAAIGGGRSTRAARATASESLDYYRDAKEAMGIHAQAAAA